MREATHDELLERIRLLEHSEYLLDKENDQFREMLQRVKGALRYAYEDRVDQFYLNWIDDIDKLLNHSKQGAT